MLSYKSGQFLGRNSYYRKPLIKRSLKSRINMNQLKYRVKGSDGKYLLDMTF